MPLNRVHYFSLAKHLSTLPIEATCSDLAKRLAAFDGCDAEYKERLAAPLGQVLRNTGWIDGVMLICDVLQADNPRFIPALFMDWCLEEV